MRSWMVSVFIIMVIVSFIVEGCSDDDVPMQSPVLKTTTRKPVVDKTVNRILMKVDKLSCGSCLTAISQKLSTFEGVVGLGADLSQGLVAVDHTKAIESSKIAEAITSIGYPAKILSETEIDFQKAFNPNRAQQSQQYGGGCCSGSGSASPIVGVGDNDLLRSSSENYYSTGCPYVESVRSRGCYASSDSWKELVNRFSKKSNNTKEVE